MTGDLAARLVEAAKDRIEDYCVHTDPVSEGCDCVVQAKGAVVAVLRVLADDRTVDKGTWWEQHDEIHVADLLALAEEIESR